MFNKIDFESWNRKEHYMLYINELPCTYSMTVNVDISDLIKVIKINSLKFYPVIIYGITKIINKHREFKMSLNEEGELGYYDKINPNYTIFHKNEETFSSIWTEYNEDFNVFLQNYLADMDKYSNDLRMSPKEGIANQFNFSSIPWTSFTGFNLNLQKGYNYLAPIITIGKYYKENEKILLPLAIQVNHAVCDGFHVARLINELEKWCSEFNIK